jgi:hypothetical protein
MRHGHSRRSQRTMNQMTATKLLDAVGDCRRTISRTMAEIPINGPEYKAIDRVIAEIDGLAEVLTGDRSHFHLKAPAAASRPSE